MNSLYHYCSTSSFVSIISRQSIYLSSLQLSNDTMEGKLLAAIIDRLAQRDELDESSIKNLQTAVNFLENSVAGLGFCLSNTGDLLSQWRGYAADAKGFSIGFSKEYFESLSETSKVQECPYFSLHMVEYDIAQQEDIVRPAYKKMKQIVDSGCLNIPHPGGLLDMRSEEESNDDLGKNMEEFKKAYEDMLMTMCEFFPKLYALKTEAFSEEQEWRLISYFLLWDASCSFRAANNLIVPYREYKLIKLEADPITEVIIGPKNLTPINVVESFLNKHGFNGVNVHRSCASYR